MALLGCRPEIAAKEEAEVEGWSGGGEATEEEEAEREAAQKFELLLWRRVGWWGRALLLLHLAEAGPAAGSLRS